MKIGTTLSFAGQTAQNVPVNSITEDAYRAAPLVPAMVNGKFGNTSQYQNVGNPVLDAQSVNDLSQTNKLQGSGYLEIKPVSSIAFRSTFGADLEFYNDRAYTYAHPNDTTFFNVTGGSQGPNLSTLTVASLTSTRWVWSNTLSYNGEFGKNKLTVLVGTTDERILCNSILSYQKKEFLLYKIDGISEWRYPHCPTSSSGSKKNQCFLLRAGSLIVFDRSFLLTANLRADGSSVFQAENRWGYFPCRCRLGNDQ